MDDADVLLQAAVAAPSLHNSQPWLFGVRAGTVELFADPSRWLRHADPDGRSLLISVGAALFDLRVAAEHLGYRPAVQVGVGPLAHAADPVPVATMTLGAKQDSPGRLGTHYPFIEARRTNRRPFHDVAVPPAVVAELRAAARDEGAVLRCYQEPDELARLTELLHDADRREREDVALPGERAAWIGGPGRDDGIPVRSLGPRPVDARTAFRDLGEGVDAPRDYALFERAPTVAVLSTARDDPPDWVRAGEALQHVLLVATRAGLAASFVNQPLESAALRAEVEPGPTGAGHPQMVLRIGYGDPVPPTPRRPIGAVRRESTAPG